MTDPTVKPSISSVLRDLNRRIGQLERRQNITTDLSALEADIATNGGDITGLDGRLTTAEGDISTLQTDFATEQGFIDTLQSEMNAAEADISALQGQTYTRWRPVKHYRDYDGTSSGYTTLTLPSSIDGVSLSGADMAFGVVTLVGSTAGFATIMAINDTQGTGNNINGAGSTGGSNINNSAFMVELDGSRRFRLYRQASIRALVDIFAIGFDITT